MPYRPTVREEEEVKAETRALLAYPYPRIGHPDSPWTTYKGRRGYRWKANLQWERGLTRVASVVRSHQENDVVALTFAEENFRRLVKEMRSAQKRYFAHGRHEDLTNAKKLERMVDEKLEPEKQQILFDVRSLTPKSNEPD